MNPCPCGYYPDMNRCTCTAKEASHYLAKISQPLLDRIDLCAQVSPIQYGELHGRGKTESSLQIRKRVEETIAVQEKRYQKENICFNGELHGSLIEKYCTVTADGQKLMEQAFQKMNLSARSYHRILKVGRTIADMQKSEEITRDHIAEALSYRAFDKKYRG